MLRGIFAPTLFTVGGTEGCIISLIFSINFLLYFDFAERYLDRDYFSLSLGPLLSLFIEGGLLLSPRLVLGGSGTILIHL